MTDLKARKICSICQSTYTGWGNNAAPVNAGRCCDECNDFVVIPARLHKIWRDEEIKSNDVQD